MNATEVGRLLGLGRNSVYDAAGRGEIPHRRIGRRLIFSRAALLSWLGVADIDPHESGLRDERRMRCFGRSCGAAEQEP